MSARRVKQRFTQIHVSIPVRILEDFDDTLDYNQSRSKKIVNLIKGWLDSDPNNLYSYTEIELLEQLQYRFKKDTSEDVLIQSLLQILTK